MNKKSKLFGLFPLVLSTAVLLSCGGGNSQESQGGDTPNVPEQTETETPESSDAEIPTPPEVEKVEYKDFTSSTFEEISEKDFNFVYPEFIKSMRQYEGLYKERSFKYYADNKVEARDISFNLLNFETFVRYARKGDLSNIDEYQYYYHEGDSYCVIKEHVSKNRLYYDKQILNNLNPEITWFYQQIAECDDGIMGCLFGLFDVDPQWIGSYQVKYYHDAATNCYKASLEASSQTISMYFDNSFVYQGEHLKNGKVSQLRQFAKSNSFETEFCNSMVKRHEEALKNPTNIDIKVNKNYKDLTKNTYKEVAKEIAEPILEEAFNKFKNKKESFQYHREKNANGVYYEIDSFFDPTAKSGVYHADTSSSRDGKGEYFKIVASKGEDQTIYQYEHNAHYLTKSSYIRKGDTLMDDLAFAASISENIYSFMKNIFQGAVHSINPNSVKFSKDETTNIYKLDAEDGVYGGQFEAYFDSNMIYQLTGLVSNSYQDDIKLVNTSETFDGYASEYIPFFDDLTPLRRD